jgi:L-fuconolactonase
VRASQLGRRQFLASSAALGSGLVSCAGGAARAPGAAPAAEGASSPRGARIDSHQHFWTYGVENYAWIEPASPVARNFGPDDLQPELARGGIDGTVLIEARSQIDETEDLLAFAANNRFIRGAVGWLPLVDPGVGDLIARYAANPKLRGLRHAIGAEADPEFMLRADFNAGIAQLERAGLRFDLLLVPSLLRGAPRFVDAHPHQIFILDHCAKPMIRERALEPWAAELRELARRPNVYCKLSGLVTEAAHDWAPGDLRPYLDVALEAFTPRRLMFGSDWPMCLLATTYGQWLTAARDWAARLSVGEQGRIFGGTALEAYGL